MVVELFVLYCIVFDHIVFYCIVENFVVRDEKGILGMNERKNVCCEIRKKERKKRNVD